MIRHYPFSVAAHSYFSIKNKVEARRIFFKSQSTEPVFAYAESLNVDAVQDRLQRVADDLSAKKSLLLVEASARLQLNASQLEQFRRANLAVAPIPRQDYAMAILCHVGKKVTPETQQLWDEAIDRTGEIKATLVSGPSQDIFDQYRSYLKQYTGIIHTKNLTVSQVLDQQLVVTGLASQGWATKIAQSAAAACTVHKMKQINIGESYQPRTMSAKKRIVLHEVYGHALRGPQHSIAEAEGFAILLEQLTSKTFKYRRSYRYLAVALGWGALGQAMTFRQVYEIIWRIMVINSHYSKHKAQEHAFDEACRAFRGGRPDIAGAVFLKDSIYFDANIAIWNVLIDQELSYNEFVDIIEGRRTLLS